MRPLCSVSISTFAPSLQRPAEDHSYCVDGFVVQHQASKGSIVSSEKIDVVSSYSFEWNQELHTVTVEAFNSLGNSASNTKMTLDGSVRRESRKQSNRII